jgi:hypothetical protein
VVHVPRGGYCVVRGLSSAAAARGGTRPCCGRAEANS